ncbi:hypothetical protein DAPPUDRAFT_106150 [Daphnia pulex]|uniref:Uncharacterized protein n=1 Tax=Daphnia pulex TaxID=6669 RepID=E9GSW9_DAPPU|nr:hypothetical protein DAPPUDRAFT_106150 [Daphnia pulex]|eukprot:EFX77505.1 hypothetical protein DAPPUDRAFT_106150 [Daphnia pulex]
MATPMNEASRMGITAHITRWINNIQQYDNVPMDLTVYNLVLEAESNLRDVYKKFKRLTETWWQRVTRDIKQAGMTQEQFDAEVDNQTQVEVEVEVALVIVRRKREKYKNLVAREERERQMEEGLAGIRDRIAPQIFPNNSQLIKSSCTFQVLEDPVSSVKHQPPDFNTEKMAAFSPSEGPATSLDSSAKLLPPGSKLESAASLSQSEGPATSLDSSVNLLPPGSKLESAASLSQSEGPATSLDSSANLLPPDSKPESAAAPSFSERPASPLDKRQSSPKDPQHAVLSLLRRSASVPGRQHDSKRKKNKSTPSVKPIILKTQTEQKNPDETEPPSEEAPEADDDKQTDLTAIPYPKFPNTKTLGTKVRSKNLQFVWDPGGKDTNRVSRLSLGPASETSLKPTTKRNDQQEDELTDSKRIRSQRNSCSSVFTLSDPAVLASLPTNQKMIQPTIQPSISNPMEWALVGRCRQWILPVSQPHGVGTGHFPCAACLLVAGALPWLGSGTTLCQRAFTALYNTSAWCGLETFIGIYLPAGYCSVTYARLDFRLPIMASWDITWS